MPAIKTILYPTDLSEAAHVVFELAYALTRDLGARLVVLHVTSVPDLAYTGYGAPIAPLERKEYLAEKKKALEALQAPDTRVAIERFLAEGDPAEEILRVAADLKVDLIVIGTHSKGGLLERILGSVAEEVFRKSPCPVLTMRQQTSQLNA